MSRPQPGFAAVDPPERWAPTRGRFRPERLEAPLDSLPGVGPTLKKRLAKLGLERTGDLLDHRPRRYERPAPEKRIADLFGDEEVLIEGEVLRTSLRRGRGRLQILTAQVSDGTGQISATWFNQPWLQEKLKPGTHVRLRGAPNRFGFAVRSFDLNGGSATADFAPVYPASEEISAAKLRELVEAVLPLVTDHPDPLPARAEGGARAAAPRRRPGVDPQAALAGGGRGGKTAARVRRVARTPAGAGAAHGRARAAGRRRAPRAGRADRPLPGRAAVRADRAPGGGDRRDRRSTSPARRRCSACSRATSAPARRSSRSTRSCGRSRPAARAR